MQNLQELVRQVNKDTFEDIALEVFRFQAIHNVVYQEYLAYLHIELQKIKHSPKSLLCPLVFSTMRLLPKHQSFKPLSKAVAPRAAILLAIM
ncbi:MAG: hypothetical protein R2822_04765 [Spirosomataceae bacterium]